MSEKEIRIPFSYCRLSRATTLLGLEPSDFVNLAVTNKIELSMMLRRFHCRILLRESFSNVKEWYSSLSFPRTFNALSGQTRSITKHSYIEFTNGNYHDPDKLLSGYDIFIETESQGFITGYGFAHGLWRVMADQFEASPTVEGFFPGFFPCLSGTESPVIQILPAKPFIDYDNGGRFNFEPHEFKANYDDLWVTNYDLKRIIDSDLDFENLSTLDDVERPELSGNVISKTNTRSEKAMERHARNELTIIRAAFRFRDECPDLFNSECVKKDGSYNFSAWARQVVDKVALFPDKECPIKSTETVATYISKVFK